MRNTYILKIPTESKEMYESITSILNLNPKPDIYKKKQFSNYNIWSYVVEENENDEHFDFINEFLDILEPKFEMLHEIGVEKSDIEFWLLYEYDNQCNMEFNPELTKRIGENQITLCISCWDSGKN